MLKDLKRLEKLLTKKPSFKNFFLFETIKNWGNESIPRIRCVRTLDGTYKTRTHNIDIYEKKDGRVIIWWENNNSKEWFYEGTEKECREWWNKFIIDNNKK